MALGVLNNLSAIYAEHNLNNTSSSLQTVLQQLSSGSRINSGADDAAGLSLVNGLKANSTALTQSATNATEGVGLLQVADGALSQVTSLLNRAITLATEASNGTLNSTQDGAANMEYQSIMAEINNIGSTTTYNQQTVFSGTNVAIYTGDSSTNGSAIDNLNIHTLSQAGVGDTNGVMSYGNSSGSTGSNVFINLSNEGTKASLGDSLNAAGSTVLNVNYLQTGAGGVVTNMATTITVGTGTSYSNTAQGLITAINNAGLGLSASFSTAAQAGAAASNTAAASVYGGGSSADTGIVITGVGVGAGTNAGQIGTLVTKGDSSLDPLSGTLNITDSNGDTHALNLGLADFTDNIANLAATINAAGYGITATLGGPGNATLMFTTTSSKASVSGVNITDAQTAADLTQIVGGAPGALVAGVSIGAGNMTLQFGSATDLLSSGTITIKGQDSGTATKTFTLGQSGATDNLADLVKTINTWATANPLSGITASISGGTTLKLSYTGEVAGTAQLPTLTKAGVTAETLSAPTALSVTGTPTVGQPSATTVGTLTLTGGAVTDTLDGTLKIGTNSITLGGTGTTDTLQDLAKTINSGAFGVTATYNQATQNIVFTSSNAALAASVNPPITWTIATNAISGDQTNVAGSLNYAPAGANATTAENFYTTGISSAAGISDQTTAVVSAGTTYGGTLNAAITSDINAGGGTATISYSDAAGQSLVGTTLLNQTSAQSALTVLNLAIGDISAQDGYIGAQINTLNSISQVMSTQMENVVSAQNAIQATDYASATSNMSKYEILSQTGIAALAQANQVEQEVTKLLQ